MCILFISRSEDEAEEWRLIVASNRDESYARPATVAAPWTQDPHVIGGRDMEPGREGGTWLAASPLRRRIGVLLNLPGAPVPPNALGRGSVVSDYVLGNLPASEYVKQYNDTNKEYGPFNLVTIELENASSSISFYSNYDKVHRLYNKRSLAFSNSLPESPLKKVDAGLERFEGILNEHGKTPSSKEDMIEHLLQLLKWDKLHLPDEELKRRKPHHPELSAVFVDIPRDQYGTRTHTIILVDKNNNMDFLEWTKVPNQTDWLKTHLQYKI